MENGAQNDQTGCCKHTGESLSTTVLWQQLHPEDIVGGHQQQDHPAEAFNVEGQPQRPSYPSQNGIYDLVYASYCYYYCYSYDHVILTLVIIDLYQSISIYIIIYRKRLHNGAVWLAFLSPNTSYVIIQLVWTTRIVFRSTLKCCKLGHVVSLEAPGLRHGLGIDK